MRVQIESVDYYGGAPAWLTTSHRRPGYWIRGRGFGNRPGVVTINGRVQRVVEWSPDRILIALPDGYPFPSRDRIEYVEVSPAPASGEAANDARYVLAA
jgi:hypothetical protein